jgi:hypothetical protein
MTDKSKLGGRIRKELYIFVSMNRRILEESLSKYLIIRKIQKE